MNRQEIRDRVRLLSVLNTGDVTDAEIHAIIDDAVHIVATRYRWPWAVATSDITTVKDQQNYDLPANFSAGIKLVDNDHRRWLTHLSVGEALERWGGDFPSSTTATHFFIFDDDIHLIPIPSAADTNRYKLYYEKDPTLLTTDGTSPEWHNTFHHIIVNYVLSQLYVREEYFDQANIESFKFNQGIERMKQFYNRRFPDLPLIFGDGVLRRGLGHPNMPFLDSV